MLRSSSLVLFSLVLSGCSLMSQEKHQQTLKAIENIETNVEHNGSLMKQSMASQQVQIATLKRQLNKISTSIADIQTQKETISPLVPPPIKPTIVYVEKKQSAQGSENKTVLGELEWVWFDDTNSTFRTRIDTGATTSSLNASDIQEYERDGKTWVRFTLASALAPDQDPTKNKPEISTIEAPVKRWVKIRQASSASLERRPVVELRIRLGKLHEKAQFTLADRSHMEFPVLLGRDFFKDIAVIDVAQSYIYPKFVATAPEESLMRKE